MQNRSPHNAASEGLRAMVVIPARLESTRLPQKMLLADTGQPLIQHTYQAALAARLPVEVLVATDHPSILEAVEKFGGKAVLTDPAAQSGTERLAEVAATRADIELFVNLQGDEPELPGALIDQVIDLLVEHPDVPMATLAVPIRDRRLLDDPSCVKVVCDARGRALYFSRSRIPFPRTWDDTYLGAEPPIFLQHLGLYAYRRELLLQWKRLPAQRLERIESLEQLRALENGLPVQVGRTEHASKGIDTPEDYRAFVQRYRQRKP
ncbi:MAG: 3-deoxy-manno-octulosonate cytidylyltransferase [Pirellulaceae bacterium]|nr:MAG: 3-deoxy-manno-octulosonate cytidylyltransferase [Pirellulaceae bacterium]